MKNDDPRKHLAQAVAETVQQLLRNSPELSSLLKEAQAQGYDVLLSVFSGIMVRQRPNQSGDQPAAAEPLPLKFEFTERDKHFLHSIGVCVPEEE